MAVLSVSVVTPDGPAVAEGDSITIGVGGASTYVDQFGPNKSANITGAVSNLAISSSPIGSSSGVAGSIWSRLAADAALVVPNKLNRYSVYSSYNDYASGITTAQYITNYRGLLTAAATAGFNYRVVCTTIDGDIGGGPFHGLDYTGWRAAVDPLIRQLVSDGYAAAYVDFAATSMGVSGVKDDPTYYQAGGVHPKTAGYTIMEVPYRAAMNSLP